MKKTVNLIAALCVVLVSCAQDVSMVPAIVLNSFKLHFPSAVDVEWDLEAGYFNADFDIDFKDHEAWLDSAGNLIKHQQDISSGSLPATVKETIKRDFASYRIDDIKKIEEGTNVTYKIELEKGPEERIIVLDVNGKVVQNQPD